MKVSYRWIQDYVSFSGSPEALAELLTLCGHEVEGIDAIGSSIEGIVTGKILSIEPHPNADRLVITQVTDGQTTHQIVTGAKNISVGDVVPVSLPGAVLANGTRIQSTDLRGVPSHGMLCSETELGLISDSKGIWILDPDTPLGLDFVDYAQLKDFILHVAILPNRGDALSMIGLARDIAAVTQQDLKLPNLSFPTCPGDVPFSLHIDAASACPLYTGRYLTLETPGTTPLWMQRRLSLSGITPRGLLVDITNYVLLEWGQPLHAFDAATLQASDICVALSSNALEFPTLDDKVAALTPSDLLIFNGNTPIAIAGVMGGKSTAVTETTRTIFLESAYFLPSSIRKTATRLACRTESAIRFEKSVDPQGVYSASDRACHLYYALAGASIYDSCLEHEIPSDPIFNPEPIPFSYDAINALLGTAYTEHDILSVLTRLGFVFHEGKAAVPSWRQGTVEAMPCLAEEVARILGYHTIPVVSPTFTGQLPATSSLERLQLAAQTHLCHLGFSEINTFTMISPEDIHHLGLSLSDCPKLLNPLTPTESVMRPHLLPSFLKVISHNQSRQHANLQLFEIGKVFQGHTQSESLVLGIALTGDWRQGGYKSPHHAMNTLAFPVLKSLVETLLKGLGFEPTFLPLPAPMPLHHPVQTLAIQVQGTVLGSVGFCHPTYLKSYDLDKPVAWIELSLSLLSELSVPVKTYAPFSKFPSTRRDIALRIPNTLRYEDIEAVLRQHQPQWVSHYTLFDHFESESLGPDHKSLAIAFTYQNPEGTLSDEDVNQAHAAYIAQITAALPVQTR